MARKLFISLLAIASVAALSADGDKKERGDRGDRAHRDHKGSEDRADKSRDSSRTQPTSQSAPQRQPRPVQHVQQSEQIRQNQQFQQGRVDRVHQREDTFRSPQSQITDQNYRFSNQNREALKNQARKFQEQRRSSGHDINRKAADFKRSYGQREKYYQEASRSLTSQLKGANSNYNTWLNQEKYRSHNYRRNYGRNNDYGWNGVSHWLGWGATVNPYLYNSGDRLPLGANWQNYANNYYDGYYAVPNGNYYNDVYDAYISQYVYPYSSTYSYSIDSLQEWLPLGIFALGSDITQASTSDIFMELAVNKEGDLAGTYFNSTTNRSFPLEGYVDRDTREVYWRVPGESRAPEMLTGIYNLTQDVGTVQLTFPGGPIQNWVLVRVND